MAITPFEGLPGFYLGWLGNLLTLVPIAIFLVRTPTAAWAPAFLGSRLQMAVLALLFGTIISHVLAAQMIGAFPAVLIFGRKIVLFLMVGVFAWTFGSNRWVDICLKTLVMATAVFTVISMLDFYLGMRLFPGTIEAASLQGASALDVDATNVNRLRFRGLGLPINRTANWLLLPTFLALGWWMRGKLSLPRRALALGAFVLLLGGLLGTVGRTAILGFGIGSLLLLPLMVRRYGQVWGLVAGTTLTIIGLYYLMLAANVGDLISYRFAQDATAAAQSTRFEVWSAAFALFLESPVYGVGSEIVQLLSTRRLVAHNVFINFLAESGLMGFIPFAAMIVFAARGLTRKLGADHAAIEYWRPFVLAAFVALLVQNQFNDYPWERYQWICFGYAIAVERAWIAERRVSRPEPPGLVAIQSEG